MSMEIAELFHKVRAAFVPCLQCLLSHQLHQLSVQNGWNHSLLPENVGGIYKICFNLSNLIQQICHKVSNNWGRAHLEELVELFLSSINRLSSIGDTGPLDTFIELSLSSGREVMAETASPIAAQMAERLDFLSFPGLSLYIGEGDELLIRPRYHRGTHIDTPRLYWELSFELGTYLPWLQWNDEVQGFKGTVPCYSLHGARDYNMSKEILEITRKDTGERRTILCIEVKAVFKQRPTSPSVSLSRTIRTRLSLVVIERSDPSDASGSLVYSSSFQEDSVVCLAENPSSQVESLRNEQNELGISRLQTYDNKVYHGLISVVDDQNRPTVLGLPSLLHDFIDLTQVQSESGREIDRSSSYTLVTNRDSINSKSSGKHESKASSEAEASNRENSSFSNASTRGSILKDLLSSNDGGAVHTIATQIVTII